MNKKKVAKLVPGIYKFYWKGDGTGKYSVASVGIDGNGHRWFAPSNWQQPDSAGDYWDAVKKVKRVFI